MTQELIKVALLFLAVLVGAWCLTGLMRRYALSRKLLAMPNERSAHTVPTPCGGGVALMGAFLAGLAWLAHWEMAAPGLVVALAGGGVLVGLIGFVDDCGHVDPRWRLLAHFAAAGWVLAWLGGLPPLPLFGVVVDLGWAGHLLAAVYLVWLLNLYNFMDGIDGIASAEAITVALGGVLCLWLAGAGKATWPVPLLAAAVAGFLYWNLPPAGIFMGDSGSGFLGLVLGAFSVWAGGLVPELFWAWLVLLGVFVVDATFTLLRRILQGETFYKPHSTHAYQHAARHYGGHGKVSLAVAGINLVWLLPWAALVALGLLDGLLAVLIAYIPLVGLACYFNAGGKAGVKMVAADSALLVAAPPAFPPWPCFSEEEVETVARVLRSGRVNYWTGEEGGKFEQEFAAWARVEHAVALSNGSVALEAVLRALEIGPGDEVVVTPRSFVASASCVLLAGARPVCAEVDRESQTITAATIRPLLTPRTRAIICVHLAGWPCDMDPIMELAERHDLTVIEDCAQAHGARYKGRPVGGIGHVGTWSFCQDKIITTGGEGGMVTTNDREIWQRVWSYKDHGKAREAVYRATDGETPPAGQAFRWVHESVGTNARMLEMQAALGRLQLGRLARWHEQRRACGNFCV